jgi:Putative peptidoglycan binding domain
VPRRIADDDDETPRRRRKPKAAVIEAVVETETTSERGLLLRVLFHSPKDTVAATLAVAAIGAIVTNALFLQSGPHPSPMFGSVVTLSAPGAPQTSALPRQRPTDAKADAAPSVEPKPVDPKAVEPKAADPKALDQKASEIKASDPKSSDARTADPLANLVKSASGAPIATSSIPRPPVSIPISHDDALSPGGSRRVAAVQRALTEYGYGQLRTTGIVGPDTQAAIMKFEHARKIPATGQITERMVRELGTMIGHPID